MRGGRLLTIHAARGAAIKPPTRRAPTQLVVDGLRAEADQEPERRSDRDDELGGVDGADDLARLDVRCGEERRRADRAPSAAAERVHRAGDESERRHERLLDAIRLRSIAVRGAEEAEQDVDAEAQEDPRDHGSSRFGRERGKNDGAEERSDEPRQRQKGNDAPVDVAELPVRGAGGQRGADLGQVDARRSDGRRDAHGQKEGGRRDAVRHPESAVDELGKESDYSDD